MGQCQTRLAQVVRANVEDDEIIMTSKPTLASSEEEEDGEEATFAPSPPQPSSLSIFNDDIILAILSFIADVPLETTDKARPTDGHSTLTHTLPFVSKHFHKLTCRHDLYWKHALLRLVHKRPTLWEEGLKRVIFEARCDEMRGEILYRNSRASRRRDKRTKHGQPNPQNQFESKISTPSNSEPSGGSSNYTAPPPTNKEEILQLACAAIEIYPPRHNNHTTTPWASGTFQHLYHSILQGHMRYQGPVFCMPSRVRLGSTYGLHFFEPRYRLLISEVMASYPASARRGQPIPPVVPGVSPTPGQAADDIKASVRDLFTQNDALVREHQLPTFIHAHQVPVRTNAPATIVQVKQCVIYPNGTADVFLEPLAYIVLEEIWERRGTGGLMEARGIRMGKEASEGYERWCGMRGLGRGDGRGRGQMLPIP